MPELLSGESLVDGETFQELPGEVIKEAYQEWQNVLLFIHNVELGIVTLTTTEYLNLPHYVHEAWNEYKRIKNEMSEKK